MVQASESSHMFVSIEYLFGFSAFQQQLESG